MTGTLRIAPHYAPAILTSTGALDKPNRNHLLYEFRLSYNSDKWATTIEWLFQLQRHWYAWQHDSMGTPYVESHDPGGPADREYSEETGEDSDYWSIDDILGVILQEQGERAVIQTILHTFAVLHRVLNLLESEEASGAP